MFTTISICAEQTSYPWACLHYSTKAPCYRGAEFCCFFALGLIKQDKDDRTCFSFSWMQIRINTAAQQTSTRCRQHFCQSAAKKQTWAAEVVGPAGVWSRLLVSHSQTACSRYRACILTTVIGHNWCSNNATLTSRPSRGEPFLCFSKKKGTSTKLRERKGRDRQRQREREK